MTSLTILRSTKEWEISHQNPPYRGVSVHRCDLRTLSRVSGWPWCCGGRGSGPVLPMPSVVLSTIIQWVCQEEKNLIIEQSFEWGCTSYFLMWFLFICTDGTIRMQYLSLKGSSLSSIVFLFIFFLHHIIFSCSFYSFGKYCHYPNIIAKNECQSVMKRSFILSLWWKQKGPAKGRGEPQDKHFCVSWETGSNISSITETWRNGRNRGKTKGK